MVSMIRFTHSSWTGERGGFSWLTAAMNVKMRATTFTVSWNWRNLRMLSARKRKQADDG